MPTYTVKADVDGNALNPQTSRKVVRLSDGTIFVVYVGNDGARTQIYVSYSIDNGVNWTEEQVSFAVGATTQARPSIASDSLDQVHVAWQGTGWGANPGFNNIQYRMRNAAGVWQAQEGVTDEGLYIQSLPAIAIDSADTVHLVWLSNGGFAIIWNWNIIYRQRTVAWQAAELVTNDVANNRSTAIAIDSSDNIHVAWWTGAFPNCRIKYRLRTVAWQAIEVIDGPTTSLTEPSIAIDSLGNPHVVYDYNDGILTTGIRYARRNGAWGAFETVCFVLGQTNVIPTINIDSGDNVHVCWTGNGWGANPGTYNLLHATRAAPWPTPDIIVDNASTDMVANLLWSQDPTIGGINPNLPLSGYMVVFQETTPFPVTTNVMILLSDDLSWIVAPTVTTDPASAISQVSATENGTLDNDGGEACQVRFQFGLTDAYGTDTAWQPGKVTGNTFEETISGLEPNTTYHFRAQAKNSAGTASGADRTFTTQAENKPVINKAYALSREEL